MHLLIERVIPKMSHVFPVLNDTVLHRVSDLEVRPILCSLVTNHDIFQLRSTETLLGSKDGAANDRWEDWRKKRQSGHISLFGARTCHSRGSYFRPSHI